MEDEGFDTGVLEKTPNWWRELRENEPMKFEVPYSSSAAMQRFDEFYVIIIVVVTSIVVPIKRDLLVSGEGVADLVKTITN